MKNITKIIIFTSGDFPYGGAPESFVRQLALGIYECGGHVEIIRYWGDRYRNINNLPVVVTNYLFNSPPRTNIGKLLDLIFKLLFLPIFFYKLNKGKGEKVLFYYGIGYAHFIIPSLVFCKIFNIKVIRVITDFHTEEVLKKEYLRKIKYLSRIAQFKYIDKYLNGVLVLSTFLYNKCLKCGVDEKKIIHIPHFIDVDKDEVSRRNFKLFRIGYSGDPAIKNGIIELLKAFELVSNIFNTSELVIIGQISENVMEIINSKDIKLDKVTITGQLLKDDVETELSLCHVLINPRISSLWSDASFPTKLGEYFSMKRPVVSTKVGDLPKFLKDKEEIIFCEPDNPNSLAESIMYVFNNGKEAERIANKGYVWAKNNLDYKINAKKLLNRIEDLI